MRHTLMTEKIARRGVRIPAEYAADSLDQVLVDGVATKSVVALKADHTVKSVSEWIASGTDASSHQGFPVLDSRDRLIGVLTRRDILAADNEPGTPLRNLIRCPPKFVYEDCTVRQAADHMVNHGVGRLPVVTRVRPHHVVGMVTRSDILSCYRRLLDENRPEPPTISFPGFGRRRTTRLVRKQAERNRPCPERESHPVLSENCSGCGTA